MANQRQQQAQVSKQCAYTYTIIGLGYHSPVDNCSMAKSLCIASTNVSMLQYELRIFSQYTVGEPDHLITLIEYVLQFISIV